MNGFFSEASPEERGGGRNAILETKDSASAEALCAAVEKWKMGIPRMKAAQATTQEARSMERTSVLVPNLPDAVSNWSFFKKKNDQVLRGTFRTDVSFEGAMGR